MSISFEHNVWLGVIAIACLIYPGYGIAGEDDSYTYTLEVNNNDKVCSHMKEVYNHYFKRPFAISTNLSDYAEGEKYALPLLPGVKRDPRLSLKERFSLQPTSPEFDAIKWQEGRVKYPDGNIGEQPIMVANVDVDNDGTIETVIKFSFMAGYVLAAGGGEDALAIFRNNAIELDKQPLDFYALFRGQNGRQSPAHITGDTYELPYEVIRLFTYGGINYLSAYGQHGQPWPRGNDNPVQSPDREYMDVLQYRSGGDNLGKGKWSPLKIDTICQFRMTVAK